MFDSNIKGRSFGLSEFHRLGHCIYKRKFLELTPCNDTVYMCIVHSSRLAFNTPTILLLLVCAGELDANRSVPFRLTPAIQHLVSPIGIAGPMHMSMVAFARYRATRIRILNTLI